MRTLSAARRPVILAGIAALRCAAGAELVRLAELAGIPVVVSPMAKGVFPEDHPYFAGVLDMAGYRVVWDLLAGADLILAAGFDPVELISPWSVATPVLHLDTTPNTDQVYASAHELVGHVAAILGWLCAQWSGEPRWAGTEVAAHRARLRAAWLAGRAEGRLNPSDVVAIAREAAPRDAIVTTDVGSHKIMAGQVWQAAGPRSVLIPNGLSAMGFGVPAAIAAKLTQPDRPVIALVGDGGFAMAATEMRIASALGLPVTVVVFADGSLNRIELRQQVLGYPPTGTRMDGMDLVALAEAMDCERRPGGQPGGPGEGAGRLRHQVAPADRRGAGRPGPVRGPVLDAPARPGPAPTVPASARCPAFPVPPAARPPPARLASASSVPARHRPAPPGTARHRPAPPGTARET